MPQRIVPTAFCSSQRIFSSALYYFHFLVVTLWGFSSSTQAATTTTRYAYAVNAYDNTVSMFTVDAASGQLRHNGWVFAGKFPSSILVHPSGRFAYVTNQTGMTISAYRIDVNTGRLIPLTTPSFDPKVVSPFWQVTDPEGRYLFIAGRNSNNIAVMAIDPNSGALTNVVGSPYKGGELPRSVAMHPSGRFVYMTSINHDLVSAYQINRDNGTLLPVPGSPFEVGDAPQFMRIHPNGKTLYLSNWNDRDITVYQIDPTTGALTKNSRVEFEEGFYPFGIGQYPDGRFIYVANWYGGTYGFAVNAENGALSPIPGSPFANYGGLPVQAEVEPSGKYLYVTNFDSNSITNYSVNAESGTLSPQQTTLARIGPRAMAFLSGDKPVEYRPQFLFAANASANSVTSYLVNAATGALEAKGTAKTGAGPTAIVVDVLGRYIYVTNSEANTISAFAIQNDGVLKEVSGSPFKAGKHPTALAIDSNGIVLYVANRDSKNMSAYAIDAQTGILHELTATNIHPASPYPLPVEPASLVIHPADRGVYLAATDTKKVAGFKYYGDGVMVVSLDNYGSPFDLGAVSALTFDPNGRYVYTLDAQANTLTTHSFNEASSVLRRHEEERPPVATGKHPQALAFHPGGRFLYVLNRDSEDISTYQIDPNSSAIKALPGRVKTAKNPKALVVDASGRYAYVANTGANTISIYAIDVVNGRLSSKGEVAANSSPTALAVTSQIQ